jgi:glycosyltransferase involved in cell wall biosynthesis
LLFGTDAHQFAARDGKGWRVIVKRVLWPRLFPLADVVIVPSSRGAALMRSVGIPDERLVVTPYVVDNDWWTKEADGVDRGAVRRAWGIAQDSPVVLFCAKLQPWKRPLDVLHAFAQTNVPQSHLVYAGEGPMRRELESQAVSLGLAERVRFLGFVNQSQLPAVYRASDLLVLPSEYEPFGVVVNEAMLCGCAATVSDRVGAGYDLISHGQSGLIFPCGAVHVLAGILGELLRDPGRVRRMGEAARKHMEKWSPAQNIQGLVQAVTQSLAPAGR